VLEQGERLALVGRNGSGKSSLLRLIRGEDVPYSGHIRRASQLKISYLPQETSQLAGSMDDFINRGELDESLFKTILRKLDFERAAWEKDLSSLSEGQNKKVLLAKSLCEPGQLYLWDEPLNYIDLFSRLQIEEVLRLARPTMILIEHDAAFVAAVSTRQLEL
jgi:lincosamide and streptogramin A transport system ATP-binding/permease protein